jgi:catechol 2,3-dioxygenase-like lactoylglutathione lyase family enzyme
VDQVADDAAVVEALSAVTLVVTDMARAVAFYDALGFRRLYGGGESAFTSYAVGSSYVNLQLGRPGDPRSWGRVILYVSNVDAMWQRVVDVGGEPDHEPADAPWGERFFHVRDPDGHELSFARPAGR